MTPTANDKRPPSQRIADDLRQAIESGDLTPGEQLASERELAARYGTARNTAREAVRILATEGLVVAEHGRGAFVRTQAPVIRVAAYLTPSSATGQRATWRGEGEDQGFQASQDIVEVATVAPPPEVRERLGLGDDQLTVVRRRILRADGLPVQLADSYYPATIAAGTELAEAKKLRGYTYAALKRLGIELDRFVDEFRIRMPSPAESRALELSAGVPVMRLVRTTYAVDGRPVEVADQVLAGDRYVLVYEVPASPIEPRDEA